MTYDQRLSERLSKKDNLFGIVRDFFLYPLLEHMDAKYHLFHGVRAYPNGLIVESGFCESFYPPHTVLTIDLQKMTIEAGDGYKNYAESISKWVSQKCQIKLRVL